MPDSTCPLCTMDEILVLAEHNECVTCGHEWRPETKTEIDEPGERVVKDAYGNVLENGDIVAMIKDLKLKGSSEVLKNGTKSKPIRLREGDHEIDCKMNGLSIALKAMYVKKVNQ
ncbi:zinc ribbon domain-containing protein YjdM [Luteolibacter algae]|uniref:Zinc ribbon domain-containing protein YjdM n=1 Tax=Luteolibacter algae TaxID=454151 RepID=A0ABW5D4E9_9BACT